MKKSYYSTQLAWSWLGLFAILAILVSVNAAVLQGFDQNAFQLIATLNANTMTHFFTFVTMAASPAITIVIAIVIAAGLYVRHQRLTSLLVISTMFGGDVIAFICKEIFRRSRPTQQLLADSGYSFPSGHVFGTVLLVSILLTLSRAYLRTWPLQLGVSLLGIAWIIIVMVARVYLRDHYASDTVASVCLASGCWQMAQTWFWHWSTPVVNFFHRRQNRPLD
ncbi:phosphatase PAP2 family protein [Lactiplantibacillus daowaiensis]|uniref:Phosphatase PAP2 family protein n=2 Tax=Lactiplantibacillus daowaiensis TaxID=2559918 RepID=A0ABW1S138_9LACO|nr:phosphatase PAP2 family protein [Lactiplantibacillus daowaiensis]